MRISDWSSDVCSSDLGCTPATLVLAGIAGRRDLRHGLRRLADLSERVPNRSAVSVLHGCLGSDATDLLVRDTTQRAMRRIRIEDGCFSARRLRKSLAVRRPDHRLFVAGRTDPRALLVLLEHIAMRSEEHTSELQSLMRISYPFFCL